MDGHLTERLGHLWRAWCAVRVIAPSGAFDAAWYASNGRLAGSRTRLIWHYVLRGVQEGRSPSPAFDTAKYLRAYPQVGLAQLNPLAHYLEHGRAVGLEAYEASPGTLPRQPLSQTAYLAWIVERAHIDAPVIERLRSRADLPELDVAGARDSGASHILLLPPGVSADSTALLHLRAAMAADPGTDVFYADEDRVAASGERSAPWFKPDWDPDLSQSGDLLGPATVIRRSLLADLGWDGTVPSPQGLRRLNEKAAGRAGRIGHVAGVLFHRAVSPVLLRQITSPPEARPLVSIIMPTRDRAQLLRKAAYGVLQETDYGPIELLILDNGSTQPATRRLLRELATNPRVKILPAPGPFNWSALNNQAADVATGEILVLLNNDVEIIQPGWLAVLVAQALRPEVGAVGAKLLYPNGTLQHAGLTIDPSGCFCHVMRGAAADAPGPFGEMQVTRSVAAVTGACLAIRRAVFLEVGGLEQDTLAVTCNDIDLCLRVRHAGYRVVYAPDAVLIHREAASRGHDASAAQQARVLRERNYLKQHWGAFATQDPYLNANLCLLYGQPALEAPAFVNVNC